MFFIIKKEKETKLYQTGKMAQQSSGLAALAENPS